jgi:two-component system, chemotaxis family, CheB/CheR fusion protein
MTISDETAAFETLLEYLRRNRGFDFTGYKRASLIRRVTKRMQTIPLDKYSDYLDYLEVHPEEFKHLFNTLLINVTSFFRDRSAWDFIRQEVVSRIVAQKGSDDPIRVWSAGCASGQEAYTIAMLLVQTIGVDRFYNRVKIYATDVDEEALAQARQATYSEHELNGLVPSEIEQFFEQFDKGYTFRKDLRRSVIFGRHDLIQDAPISRIDLLVCRNTLMYFNAETQNRIASRFHFALQESGFLFLGKAEMMLTQASFFTPIDLKHRIFKKVSKLNIRDRILVAAQTGYEGGASPLSNHMQLREITFETGPVARMVLDTDSTLILVNAQARLLFNLTAQDVGRPLQDLEISYRPVELRSCIEQVYRDRRMVTLQSVPWTNLQGETIFLDVQVQPLIDADNLILGIGINFIDVTPYKRLQNELKNSNQELEMAYEELQSTNEELETTNEELQSSNEELETTNEELQSTNEELETMNEELQSTNEELQTVNDELQRSSSNLNQSNSFLESILTSLKIGVVVVDRDLSIKIWNYKAEDVWGLRTEEALEQNFLNIDIGLPVEQLRQPMRTCLLGNSNRSCEVILDAINRRGRSIQCRVTCTTLLGIEGSVQGVILLMEEIEP